MALRLAWLLLVLLAAPSAPVSGEEDRPPPAVPAGVPEAELDRAAAARPSVVRVRWRDARFGDRTAERNAIVLRRDGLLALAGPPPTDRGTLTVQFHDGRVLRAQVVGTDAEVLLTLLKVPTTGLVPLALAPVLASSPLAAPSLGARLVLITGDGAVAAGSVRAHGRYGTVFDPVQRRSVRSTGLFAAAMSAVDEDAGAPLLDDQGRVAGLLVGRRATLDPERAASARRRGLVARAEPTEVLALPVGVLALAWPLLEAQGRLPRAGLGIDTAEVDAALRAQLGLEAGGHLVAALAPEGAAARAGLALHDIIVALDGRPIASGRSLHDVLLPFRPGAKVLIRLLRAGKPLERPVVLAERSTTR